METMTYQEALEEFYYCYVTGELRNRKNRNYQALAGSVAGCAKMGHKNPKYLRRQVSVNGRDYYVHRVIWLLVYGEWPDGQIDHIDGNPLNNRIENLRIVNNQQNQCNKRNMKLPSSGYRGVYQYKRKWRAMIRDGGKLIYLGLYEDPQVASEVYEQKAEELRGEYYHGYTQETQEA